MLVALAIVVCALNYTPGTWLSGWDTLHPELNFSLNFSRLLNGVWRNDQGLGSVAGHSHMADLPRVALLFLFNLILPTSMVRYAYVFAMFLVGPLGIYTLLQHLLADHHYKKLLSFLGSLFYMTSAGAVQQFYVPFEMFPTQYAYLPWLILYSLRIMQNFTRKDVLTYALLTLLATPQAYAAQLWYAFFGTYTLFLAGYVLTGKNRLVNLRRALVLFILTIVLNSFWLLPNLYYGATQSQIPQLAKQNRLYSQEFRLRNREFGHLSDVALLKGFYFNWGVYDFEKTHVSDLMPAWQAHYHNPFVQGIGYGVFALALFGIFISIKKRAYRYYLIFLPFFILPFILLANRVMPFNYIFEALVKIPLFEESLRFIFTKLSILLTFSYALFFVWGLAHLFTLVRRPRVVWCASIVAGGLLLFMGLPLLQGQLISPAVRVTIPDHYFDLWRFMNTQPDGTVLTLPLHTFSGWQYYSWGYQGSGFIWFPMRQPVMDRDSDRWNNYNEEAFREMHYALYAKNPDGFLASLAKYNISYVLWDTSNTSIEDKNNVQITFSREIKEILNALQATNNLESLGTFGSAKLYRVPRSHKSVEVYAELPNVLPTYSWGFNDPAFTQHGVYRSDNTFNPNAFYPFRNYLNIYDRFDQSLISIDTHNKTYEINIPQTNLFKNMLKTPDITVESDVFAETFLRKDSPTTSTLIIKPILPQQNNILGVINLEFVPARNMRINGEEVVLPQVLENEPVYLGTFHYYLKSENFINGTAHSIDFTVAISELAHIQSALPPEFSHIGADQIFEHNKFNADVTAHIDENGAPYVRITSQSKTASGALIDLSALPQSRGYIIGINSRNIRGIPLRTCLFSLYSNVCSFIDEVSENKEFTEDTFIVPPYGAGMGYSLRMDNITYGGEETVNDIREVTIFPIPFNFLSQAYVASSDVVQTGLVEAAPRAYLNHAVYRVQIAAPRAAPNAVSSLVLWKSFNAGWLAFDLDARTFLPSHYPINNWANGWTNGNATDILIFFWPQMLEYAGIIFIGLALIFILLI